jgi:ERF superfamily
VSESLAEALSAFQAETITFKKQKTATVRGRSQTGKDYEYTYKYADLGDILPVVNPLLSKHGLSWSSKLKRDEAGELMLYFRLLHVSGETDDGEMPLGVPKNCKPQELGSAMTYMRRYAITAQLNLATEEDDDAQAAQSAARQSPQPTSAPVEKTERPASAKQRRLIMARAKADDGGLSASALANAIAEVAGSDPRDWVSEEAALAWVNRSMERLPARLVDPLLAVVDREVKALEEAPRADESAAEAPDEEPTMQMETTA